MDNTVASEYRTSDLSLAAYLYVSGFDVSVDKSNYPYQFVIATFTEKEHATIQERIKEWQGGTPESLYYSAYKRLQRQVVKNGD